MGIIDYTSRTKEMGLNIGETTLNPDEFRLDGELFEGIGHDMLKSQNQLTYLVSPGRQEDGSMLNINDYTTFILPKVEIGFKFIDYTTYLKLRKYLLSKRTFIVDYFDKDFNAIVTHEMYAEPDDLTAFFNLGEKIIGTQEFVVRFVATLNEQTTYTAYYKDEKNNDISSYTQSAKWGRNLKMPNYTSDLNGYWKSDDYIGIKFRPNDQINIIKDTTFKWEKE